MRATRKRTFVLAIMGIFIVVLIGAHSIFPLKTKTQIAYCADIQAVNAPSDLTATSPAPGNIQLFWTDNSDNEVGFIVEKRSPSGVYEEIAKLVANSTTYLDGGLSLGQSYSYRVRAYRYSEGLNIEVSEYIGPTSAQVTISTTSCHYIRADATGANTGENWTDAWVNLPDSLLRGHVYYVASGIYGGQANMLSHPWCVYRFNDPDEGNQFIFIKKATQANHGTSEGWNAIYGIGQAVFQSTTMDGNTFEFWTDYYDVDGQEGKSNGSSEQHGFRICFPTNSSFRSPYVVALIDSTWVGANPRLYINLRHCELHHRSVDPFVHIGEFTVANPTNEGGAGDRIRVPDASIFYPSGSYIRVHSTGILPKDATGDHLVEGGGFDGQEYYARNWNLTDNTVQSLL